MDRTSVEMMETTCPCGHAKFRSRAVLAPVMSAVRTKADQSRSALITDGKGGGGGVGGNPG